MIEWIWQRIFRVFEADLNASITLLLDYLDGKASSIDRTMKIAEKK